MTYESFENYLTNELAWRKKEITNLYLCVQSNNDFEEVLLKSLILLIYSHWEGYIKKTSKFYIRYVNDKNIANEKLSQNFISMVLKSQIHSCIENFTKEENSYGITKEENFINKYEDLKNKKFKLKIDENNDFDNKIIDTKSNLSLKILERIYSLIGIDLKAIVKEKSEYIEERLLKNRNSIAHGSKYEDDPQSSFLLDLENIKILKDVIIFYLEAFKDDLLEYAAKEFYLIDKNDLRKEYEAKRNEEYEEFFRTL